jgi:dCTP diphosphatase
MNSYQRRIDQFAKDRDWAQFHNPKDLLLGIVEEVSEIRNIVKWEQDPKVLHRVLEDNKAELKDNIGDIYWFLALLANQHDINIDEAIDEVIENNEARFPLEDTKSRHTNRYLGGKDKQYDEQ